MFFQRTYLLGQLLDHLFGSVQWLKLNDLLLCELNFEKLSYRSEKIPNFLEE